MPQPSDRFRLWASAGCPLGWVGLSEERVARTIKRNRLAAIPIALTLGSQKITETIKTLISSGTVSRIDFVPMSRIETTAGSHVSFDAGRQALTLMKSQIANVAENFVTVVVVMNGATAKHFIMSPTGTVRGLSDDVKHFSDISLAVFGKTGLIKIRAGSERKSHFAFSNALREANRPDPYKRHPVEKENNFRAGQSRKPKTNFYPLLGTR